MRFMPRGSTVAALAGVLVAVLGLVACGTRPWTLAAQLPAQLLLMVGSSLIAASRLTGDARAKTIVVMLSVLVALYSWEIYLAIDVHALVERVRYPEYDRRSKREVALDLRRQGDTGAVPMALPSYVFLYPNAIPKRVRTVIDSGFLPLGGISDRTTVLCNESGQYAIYRADEHGFRNPHGAWRKPPRIAVVGDSFSQGHCVNDGDDWVSVMRRSVPEVLNLGMGGNGPVFMLATLREYLRPFEPPIVIWQYLEGHDERISVEMKVPVLMRYLEEPGFSQGLVRRQAEVDAIVDQIIRRALQEPNTGTWARIELEKRLTLSSLRDALAVAPAEDRSTHLPVLRRTLREAKSTVESWGGKMYFLYLPQLIGLKNSGPLPHADHDQVLAVAKDLGVEIIDLDPVLRSHPDPLSLFPYRKAFHYNAVGYAIVADAVLKGLAERGVGVNSAAPGGH